MTEQAIKTIQHKIKEHREEEEKRLMQFLSEKYHIPVVSFVDMKININALQLINEADAREAQMAVFKRLKGKVTVAVNNPNNQTLKEMLRSLENRGFTHELRLATTKTLNQIWEVYEDVVATSATVPGTISITNEDLEGAMKNVQSIEAAIKMLEQLNTMSRARKISKNVEYLAAAAIATKSSDIHLEPSKTAALCVLG